MFARRTEGIGKRFLMMNDLLLITFLLLQATARQYLVSFSFMLPDALNVFKDDIFSAHAHVLSAVVKRSPACTVPLICLISGIYDPLFFENI